MSYKNRLKNYAKGGDERTLVSTGRAASITLLIGVGIFFAEMIVKLMITHDWHAILWEAALFLIMVVLFVVIHLLNKIPMKKQ